MVIRANALSNVFCDVKLASERQHGRGMMSMAPNVAKITRALADDLTASGIDPSAIETDRIATDSAGYRLAAHRWDLVLVEAGIPAVVIDWGTLGNRKNFNNRLDEIVSAATNLRMSFESAEVRRYRPLLAKLLIVDEDAAKPTSRPDLAVFIDRLCRMISDQVLDCACVLSFDRGDWRLVDLNEELGFDQFVAKIGSRMRSAAAGSISEPNGSESDGAISLGRLLSSGDVVGVVTGLTSTSAGLSAVEAAVIASRRHVVAELRALVEADGTTETIIYQAIGDNYWIFGGRYVGIAPRRDFALLDQHDYALLCADGSIEIVELKSPGCALVRKHRNHYIVTNEIHEATSQCLNYIRSLDEQGPTLQVTYRNELGIDVDFRRAKGTVVIGHLNRSKLRDSKASQIVQTIRSYNAHLSRIQVVTYSDLLETADRALRFEDFNEETRFS